MCRRDPSVMLICVALLATGCGRPSTDEPLSADSRVTLDQVSQTNPATQRLSRDWAGLHGRWCSRIALPRGVRGLARCEVTPILNDQFLSCILTLTNDRGEGGMCLSLVVLQDASHRAFECWALVSSGEHMTATLVKPDQRCWIWSFSVVRPDGVTGTATHSWTLLDDNTWTWEVKDRRWDDGTRWPDLFLTLKRDRGSTAEAKTKPHDGRPAAEACASVTRGGAS